MDFFKLKALLFGLGGSEFNFCTNYAHAPTKLKTAHAHRPVQESREPP